MSGIVLGELIARVQDFNFKSFQFEDGVLILQVLLNGSDRVHVHDIEEIIKGRFPEFIVQITFLIQDSFPKSFKRVFGISSGKGGVGKSLTALNLALAFKDLGLSVGILDADMYAPSIPGLLGLKQKPITLDGQLIEPIRFHGLEVLSMGLFLEDGECQIWQDSLIASAFSQFFLQSNWTSDYLIVDFAGGMNGSYLACSRVCPDIELIMVSQPNKMVYRDVIRMFALVKSMNLKVLGFIENMTDEFYPDEKLLEFGIDISLVQRIATIPFFDFYKNLIEEPDFILNYSRFSDLSLFCSIAKKLLQL